ncbi:unnamed protein product [Hapterophycus canaliculatus]
MGQVPQETPLFRPVRVTSCVVDSCEHTRHGSGGDAEGAAYIGLILFSVCSLFSLRPGLLNWCSVFLLPPSLRSWRYALTRAIFFACSYIFMLLFFLIPSGVGCFLWCTLFPLKKSALEHVIGVRIG